MKKWMYVVIVLVAIVLALSGVKDTAIKIIVEKGVQAATGLKLHMAGIDVGIIKPIIDIRGLRLFNPRGFRDRVMIDMPQIYVDYDIGAFFKGTIHLREVTVNLKEFVVVKNAEGEVNVNSLQSKASSEEDKPEAKEKKKMTLQIDILNLKVGKVLYKDYSQGGEPQVQEFNVDIDNSYNNITDIGQLVSTIVVKTLAQTTISRLANIELGNLQKQLTGQFAGKLLSGAGGAAGQVEQAVVGAVGKLLSKE